MVVSLFSNGVYSVHKVQHQTRPKLLQRMVRLRTMGHGTQNHTPEPGMTVHIFNSVV